MDEVNVFGKPFVVVSADDPYLGRSLARLGYWAPTVSRFLAGYLMLHPDGLLCDVGASSGYFTVLAAEASQGRCRVLAFEPEPRQHECLVENIRRRELGNVTALSAAAGDRRGRGRLLRHRRNLGDNRMWPGNTGYRDDEWNFEDALIDVDVVSLDNELNGALPSLVKIDVQGYELHVLRGMQQTLSRAGNDFFLICEWTPKMLRTQGIAPEDLLELIEAFGFQIYVVAPEDHSLPVRLADWHAPQDDTRSSVDLICTKGSFEPQALAWRPVTDMGQPLLELIMAQLNGHERLAAEAIAGLGRLGYTIEKRKSRP